MSAKESITGFIIVVITMVIIGVLLALPVMLLWNLVIPDLFGFSKLTFLQALWLSLLCKFLFGGFKVGKNDD